MRQHITSVKISRPSKSVVYVEVETETRQGVLPVLFTADRHWDNPKSDLKMQKRHLDWCDENDALIIDVGDLFCAMQGVGDPRGSKGDIRPEHMQGDYLNCLSRTAFDFFKPYSKRFIALFKGNHETAVLKRKEVDLTGRLVYDMSREGSPVQSMGYSGYVRIAMKRKGSRDSRVWTIYCEHGSGGGGPVTKGVIQTNRRGVYITDADLLVTGHIHESWMVEVVKERLTNSHEPFLVTQLHLQLPTYKEEYLAHEGFHNERGRPPKPMGAWAVHFEYGGNDGKRMNPQRLN